VGSHQGLRTITKLSHRMVIDVPMWLQEDSESLIVSGFATQTQMLANFGLEQVRTECVMMLSIAGIRPMCSHITIRGPFLLE